jgi:hypothetical protein
MTWLYVGVFLLSAIGLAFTVIDWGRGAGDVLGSLFTFSLALALSVSGLVWIYFQDGADLPGGRPEITRAATSESADSKPVEPGVRERPVSCPPGEGGAPTRPERPWWLPPLNWDFFYGLVVPTLFGVLKELVHLARGRASS